MLDAYRDDGPLATAVGRALGRRVGSPPLALLLLAGLPLALAIAIEGDGASDGLVAGVVAWVVLVGGLASARPLTDRMRWLVRPCCARSSTPDCCGSARWLGATLEPATFALLCAITYHHYENVYGLRHRGVRPPAWVTAAGLGWDGRLLLGVVLLVAGALPAAFYVLAVLLAGLFVTETVAEWRRFRLGQAPVYDEDEEEELD